MITLKDYIGKIYKEITNAKVQSDIETLAIAEEYVNNPMLKHFSVPNIRIKNVELTIPVAVDNTQATSRNYTEREIQDVYEQAFEKVYLSFYPFKTTYVASVKSQLSVKSQELVSNTANDLSIANETVNQTVQPTTESSFKTTDDAQAVRATSVSESTQNNYTVVSNNAAVKFAELSYPFVSSEIPQDEFFAKIVPEIESNLQPKPYEIDSLPVIVETQKLKEINDPASMISIKVNIMDDAMEWTTDVDADGNATPVLNYE
ncbi:hypothetical protein [Kordia sp.]|uniref:hypothetical protein n=1 Tax=Kordia sp. TaxID=1965332 RepID=UPI003D28142D